jgi:integral membrane protein (TIGR01906 family)
VNATIPERIAATIGVVATPFVIVAVAVFLFLNPIWVSFEQDRSNAAGFTGYTPAQVHTVTGSILSDLVFGPPNFDVTADGTAGGPVVLDERSRQHMKDVRSVLMELGAAALIATILLAGAGLFSRGRRWFWRAVSLGAKVLIVGVIVVGGAFAILFEQAFEIFHEIFFPPGTYMFDPAKEKLVQLFPDQFWSETSVALAATVLALGVLVLVIARRLGREPSDGAAASSASDASAATPPALAAPTAPPTAAS